MKHTVKAWIAVVALSFGVIGTASADDDLQEMKAIAQSFDLISLEVAKSKALAAKPGVVEDAELENRKFKKGWDYEFEIVDADGAEWEVYIDAKTGKVTHINKEWF